MIERSLLLAFIVLLPWMSTTLPLNAQWSDVAAGGLLLSFFASRGVRRLRISQLDRFALLYVAAIAVSLIGASPARHGVAELGKTVYVVILYLVMTSLFRDGETAGRAVACLVWTAIAVCVAGLIYAAGHTLLGLPGGMFGRSMRVPYIGHVLRLSAGFITPELFGNYLTAIIPFALSWLLFRGGQRPAPWAAAALIAVAAAELLTFSHSWAGFLVAALVFCWSRITSAPWRSARYALAALACALVIVVNVASLVYVRDVTVERRTVPAPAAVSEDVRPSAQWPQLHVEATYNWPYYAILKALAWKTFVAHPLTGAGLGGFHDVTERAYAEGVLGDGCRYCMPHSTLFGHLAETGIVGTAALAALWIAAFVAARRATAIRGRSWIRDAALAGLAGLAVNAVNADVMHFRFFWVALALLGASSD